MNQVLEVEQQKEEHKKLVTVIVNTRKHTVPKGKICFDKVVALSGLPGGENVTFTVTYRKGEGHKPDGSLVEGECAEVKEGMVFNVTRTNKS
ncbi:MAG: multiubiquitin domain-containing protein [Acidobacteria bacterium]|nr:multiubiquitin domain-containing protein [Acidobacteriota bacterium]